MIEKKQKNGISFLSMASGSLRILCLFFFMSMLACSAPHTETANDAEDTTPALETINYDARFVELGIQLPEVGKPVANYVNVVQSGKLLFLAGKGPKTVEGEYITGKVGRDLTVEEGYAAARLVAYAQLAVLKDHLGNLNKVKRIVKVLGMVNCESEFGNQPEVVNGFSDVMVDVFGEKGKHARAAVGMGSLPRNICVEIEAVVEIY